MSATAGRSVSVKIPRAKCDADQPKSFPELGRGAFDVNRERMPTTLRWSRIPIVEVVEILLCVNDPLVEGSRAPNSCAKGVTSGGHIIANVEAGSVAV